MFMLQSPWIDQRLLYDVSDPLHPRLICKIDNTSAHLVTGDTIEWLVPLATDETNVALRSLSKGIDTLAGTFPFRTASGSWLPDRSVMAYTTPVPADNDYFFAGGVEVWLYSQGHAASLFKYRTGIGDCICRFGLPAQVLEVSPDGQYVVGGWVAGKGAQPLAVYRVSDRTRVATLDVTVEGAFWDRTGHRLFLNRSGNVAAEVWTPETGLAALAGAAAWSYLPGMSPDGSQVAYTAYADPNGFQNLRTYVYDVKEGSTRTESYRVRTKKGRTDLSCWRLQPLKKQSIRRSCSRTTSTVENVPQRSLVRQSEVFRPSRRGFVPQTREECSGYRRLLFRRS